MNVGAHIKLTNLEQLFLFSCEVILLKYFLLWKCVRVQNCEYIFVFLSPAKLSLLAERMTPPSTHLSRFEIWGLSLLSLSSLALGTMSCISCLFKSPLIEPFLSIPCYHPTFHPLWLYCPIRESFWHSCLIISFSGWKSCYALINIRIEPTHLNIT